jgi:hypothetical protein
VCIARQLIDARTHLWADRFDGVLADIFDLQDIAARSVVGAIAVIGDRPARRAIGLTSPEPKLLAIVSRDGVRVGSVGPQRRGDTTATRCGNALLGMCAGSPAQRAICHAHVVGIDGDLRLVTMNTPAC